MQLAVLRLSQFASCDLCERGIHGPALGAARRSDALFEELPINSPNCVISNSFTATYLLRLGQPQSQSRRAYLFRSKLPVHRRRRYGIRLFSI